jgi:Protein of unknown function (DUF642)
MRLKLCFLSLCVSSISIAHGQNVVVNGDFEGPQSNMIGTVSGWTVTGNVGTVGDEGFTSPDHAAAFSLGHDSQGDMLTQTLSTTIGQTYSLDFDSGVFGEPSNGPLTLQVQVFGAAMGTLLTDIVAPPGNNDFNPAPFSHYTYAFTADSTSTTLKFTNGGTGNASADVILDTVSVAAVPEPAAGVLMIIGLAPLGLVLRRNRK